MLNRLIYLLELCQIIKTSLVLFKLKNVIILINLVIINKNVINCLLLLTKDILNLLIHKQKTLEEIRGLTNQVFLFNKVSILTILIN